MLLDSVLFPELINDQCISISTCSSSKDERFSRNERVSLCLTINQFCSEVRTVHMAKRRSMRALMHTAHTLTALEHDGVCRDSKWVYEYSESYYNPITSIWRSLYRAQRIFRSNTCMAICQHIYCILITNTFCLPPLSSLACRHLTRRNISHTRNVRSTSPLPAYSKIFYHTKYSFLISRIKHLYLSHNQQIGSPTVRSGNAGCKTTVPTYDLWICQFCCQPDVKVWVVWLMLLSVESFHTVGSRTSCQHLSQLSLSPADMLTNEMNWTSASRCLTSHVQDIINPSRLKRLFLFTIKCLSVYNLTLICVILLLGEFL